jgi:DNA-directed RNA polymerase specialized sigma24 family protein
LAERSAAGDEGAFGVLQGRLRPALVRLFQERTQGRGDLAEDLAQRSVLGLWQALRGGRYEAERAAVTTFAYAIAGKVWLQHLRASGRADAALERYTRLVARGKGDAADGPTPGDHAALLQAVRDALGAGVAAGAGDGSDAGVLTEDERWLVSSWALGESDRTLAKKMGIAPSNVNVRKQRAYAKLRTYLTQLGFGKEPSQDASREDARRGTMP